MDILHTLSHLQPNHWYLKIPWQNTLETACEWTFYQVSKEISRWYGVLEKQLSLTQPVNCYSSVIITEQQRAVYSANSFRVTFAMLTSQSSSISEMQDTGKDGFLTGVEIKEKSFQRGRHFTFRKWGIPFPREVVYHELRLTSTFAPKALVFCGLKTYEY